MKIRNLLIALVLAVSGSALAHQSILVGDGQYRVTAGYTVNPAYTGIVNGIDLAVRTADGEPVEFLEESLTAVVIAPDGSELTLVLRAQSGRPGWYTGDFIPTVAGSYTFRISGFVGDVEFSEHFDTPSHSEPPVMDADTIRIP